MKIIEKLGSFYLGKKVDPANENREDQPFLYDSKNFTTHAVCVGMTGSGKTGLGISILEEAGIDKTPAIIIDPKGDLTNLLLTFSDLSPEEFLPWIDEGEAARKGLSLDQYANYISNKWKEGLASSGEDLDRIKELRSHVDLAIYTPASKAGLSISVLNSFSAPSKDQILDDDLIRDKIQSLTSSLLGLLGISADPIKSREYILISTLIQKAWEKEMSLDISTLIQQIQKPPFGQIGALAIDTFFPEKDRISLSVSLNNLLASPTFQAWMEGEPLDVNRLLYNESGKPKLSIISIMHLSDTERMFFVTLLLNECLAWIRQQPGTSDLRALLYMDEVFGFFPPVAMPPSKIPMITLLKQARAFGLGIVLVTQNPVDLDYKGLSNCGTWFIGKLQTERDKQRVIEGLNAASNGELNSKELGKLISKLENRMFIMRSIYFQNPIIFQTRWTLSYLRGPLTLPQIAKLMEGLNGKENKNILNSERMDNSFLKPNLSLNIQEYFLSQDNFQKILYEPRVGGFAKVHFIDSKNKIDLWEDVLYILEPENAGQEVHWDKGKNRFDLKNHLSSNPIPDSRFKELPAGLMAEKNYAYFKKTLALSLYQNHVLTIFRNEMLNINSKAGESKQDFLNRITPLAKDITEEKIKKIKAKYTEKIDNLKSKLKKRQEKASEKNQKAWLQKIQTGISFIVAILSTLLGKKITQGTISKTGTSLRRAGQANKESQDAVEAEEEVKHLEQEIENVQSEMEQEILSCNTESSNLQCETLTIRPRKNDILVEKIAVIWWPQNTAQS